MRHSDIGDRMKQYENCYRIYLPRNSAICVRLDMKAGHSYTKGFARPYDKIFAKSMWETAYQLCKNISGCKFGYTQSDEITLILTDYEDIKTEPWFGNNLQKIVSVTASMATHYFHEEMGYIIHDLLYSWSPLERNSTEWEDNKKRLLEEYNVDFNDENYDIYLNTIQKAHSLKLALFDSRVFLLPREEIFNVLYWRQLDCKCNSIQLLGQANFSHKQLQNKTCNNIQEMLWQEKGINWSKEPEWFKNGVALYKVPTEVTTENHTVIRNKWKLDLNIPVFTKDRNYILQHV